MKKLFFVFLLIIPHIAHATEPPVLINEVAWMGTIISANAEWLELKNNTAEDIDVTGWRLEAGDGSPKINLEGTVEANGFFVLERTSDDTLPQITAKQIYTGALSNSGEWLKLYDQESNLIDEINGADGWPGGDNATKQTMEKTAAGLWQTSQEIGGSAGAENSVKAEPTPEPAGESSQETEAAADSTPTGGTTPPAPVIKKGDIIFNEILADPIGPDGSQEFIEIKNNTELVINLKDWKITNAAKQNFNLPTAELGPDTITFFYRSESKLILNNQKELLTIYAGDKLIDQLKISSTVEGKSYSRADVARWEWTDKISPGEENPLPKNEAVPVAVIYGPKTGLVGEILNFDGSDSFVLNNDPLTYFWYFSDGRSDSRLAPKMIFAQAGEYVARLTVETRNASSTDTLKFKITSDKTAAPTTTESTSSPALELNSPSVNETSSEIPFIFISEFLPDPSDSETENEFIEIFNADEKIITLSGFQLDDGDGGSRPYTIPQNTIIKPGQYLAFYRQQTKIALNNDADSVRLINPAGILIDYTEYEETKSGSSFVLDQNFSWQMSDTPTPGEINFLNPPGEAATAAPAEDKPTSTPQILGANVIETGGTTDDNTKKYVIATGLSVIVVAGGIILQIKKLRT